MIARLARLFRRDKRGAIAVEFALVAPVFLAVSFSIFETGWMMTKSMMLEMALDKTVRELRIGRPESFTHDYVKTKICEQAIVYFDCKNRMMVELIPINDGAALPTGAARCVDRGVVTQPPHSFDPGARNKLVFVRACAIADPLTPGIGVGLRLQKDVQGGYRMIAQSAFLNEPAAQ